MYCLYIVDMLTSFKIIQQQILRISIFFIFIWYKLVIILLYESEIIAFWRHR